MEHRYGTSYHPLAKAVEMPSPEVEEVREFPLDVFNLSAQEKLSLEKLFYYSSLYLRYHQNGRVYEYRPNETSRYPFVIRDIEKFQDSIKKLYATLDQLPQERKNWFFGAKFFEAHYFQDIFDSATPEDFLFPENFIQKWIYLLKNNEFEDGEKELTLSSGSSLFISKRLSETGMEVPDEFTFKLEQDGQNIDLPLVRFGKTSEKEATIFSVQNGSVGGISEGVAKKFNTDFWFRKFENMWKIVESSRESLTKEKFLELFGENIDGGSKYEWFGRFNDFFLGYLKDNKTVGREHPLYSIMMDECDELKRFAQAKVAEPLFEAQREKRKNLNKYAKGFLRGYGSGSLAHTISLLSSILVFASRDISYITIPAQYPFREHAHYDKEHPENVIDGKIFKQMASMVQALCDKVDGIILESVPDLDSSFRIRIEKEKLHCEKYPFIQELIDAIVKK